MDKKEFCKLVEKAKIDLFFAKGNKKVFLINWLSFAEKQLTNTK